MASSEVLLDFLKKLSCDRLYLVGDIIDFWALSRKIYMPKEHVDVMRYILKMANHGTEVIYVVGNHDEPLRSFAPFEIGDVKVVKETLHLGVDGKRYAVLHGDKYDQVFRYARWLAWAGDIGYNFLVASNRSINRLRKRIGLKPWSLSAYIKNKVKGAVNFIGRYEETVAEDIARQGLDGVICGHIHHAEIKQVGEVLYLNDGDFVESCTALVEHEDGKFEIIETI